MLTLYKATEEYENIEKMVDNGIFSEEVAAELLSQINDEIAVKAINIGALIRNFDATIKGIKEEERRLAAKRQVIENSKKRLESYLLDAMIATNNTEFPSTSYKVAIRKNPASVKVVDERSVPGKYIRLTEIKEVNKKAILDHWKETGEEVDGCEIITDKVRLEVK